MKPKDRVLTYQQARELRWFVRNCTGLRTEFYALYDKMTQFKNQLDRLDKTCQTIEEFFKDKCHHCGQPHEGIYQLSEWWCKSCLEIYGSVKDGTNDGHEQQIQQTCSVPDMPATTQSADSVQSSDSSTPS